MTRRYIFWLMSNEKLLFQYVTTSRHGLDLGLFSWSVRKTETLFSPNFKLESLDGIESKTEIESPVLHAMLFARQWTLSARKNVHISKIPRDGELASVNSLRSDKPTRRFFVSFLQFFRSLFSSLWVKWALLSSSMTNALLLRLVSLDFCLIVSAPYRFLGVIYAYVNNM